ncbi:unnamed protein product [Rhodiola kirilowii]
MARAATDSEITASPAQLRFPTPSPFSVTSPLSSSSRHFVHAASLSNRAMAVILSFISALSLARPPKRRNSSQLSTSFIDHPELVYCFVVAILAFGYSALQLIRRIYDIAHRGFFVTEKVSDYTTFILDQGSRLTYLQVVVSESDMTRAAATPEEFRRSVPPFLTKTYQLVEDPSTDNLISWSEDGSSFVIWRPAEFAKDLLPKFFKHNNLSSFVRQLNTYGFRKVAGDNWTFTNEFFRRGERKLLRGISRKKGTPNKVVAAAVPLNHIRAETTSWYSGEEEQERQQVVSSNSSPGCVTSEVVEENEKLKKENTRLMKELRESGRFLARLRLPPLSSSDLAGVGLDRLVSRFLSVVVRLFRVGGDGRWWAVFLGPLCTYGGVSWCVGGFRRLVGEERMACYGMLCWEGWWLSASFDGVRPDSSFGRGVGGRFQPTIFCGGAVNRRTLLKAWGVGVSAAWLWM